MFLEKLRDPFHWLSISVVAVIASGTLGWYAFAQEEKPLPSLPDPAAAEAATDPFAIPEDADANELIEFVENLQTVTRQKQFTSQEEMIAFVKKMGRTCIEATDLGFKLEDLTPKQQINLMLLRVRALVFLEQFGEENRIAEGIRLTNKFLDSDDPELSKAAKQIKSELQMMIFPSLSEEEQTSVIDEKLTEFRTTGVTRFNVSRALEFAETMARVASSDQASQIFSELSDLAMKSTTEEIVELGKKMQGAVRRVKLPGEKMKVFGTTLNGDELNWEEYRGKVVLVDFWATWCEPCLQELPNLKANYEKYHDKGFEIVGVNLDDDRQQVVRFLDQVKLPWVNLFSDEPSATGMKSPLAMYYGILQIPSVILVDQEGTVVSTMARGPELGRLLEELLGAPDK